MQGRVSGSSELTLTCAHAGCVVHEQQTFTISFEIAIQFSVWLLKRVWGVGVGSRGPAQKVREPVRYFYLPAS